MDDLARLAKSSPTAAALLAQIQAEAKQTEDAERLRQVQEAEAARQQRLAFINSLHDQVRAQLDIYEHARVQAHEALLAAFRLQGQLPAGVMPRHWIQHLERVNLPPAVLGPSEDLYPAFPTMTATLHAAGLKGL